MSAMADSPLPLRPRVDRARLAAGLSALVLSAACAAVAVHWGLRIWRAAHAQALAPSAPPDWSAEAANAVRLYPAPHAVVASTRFRLWGVIGGGAHAGAALIGIDGKAPQAYPAGAVVVDGVRLVETGFGEAVLSRNAVRELLQTRGGDATPTAPQSVPPVATANNPWPAEGRSVQSGAESAAAEAAALRGAAQRPD